MYVDFLRARKVHFFFVDCMVTPPKPKPAIVHIHCLELLVIVAFVAEVMHFAMLNCVYACNVYKWGIRIV